MKFCGRSQAVSIWDLSNNNKPIATLKGIHTNMLSGLLYKQDNTFLVDSETSIKMLDFNIPFSRLLQAAETILNGNLEPFTSFLSECQNAL